MEPNTKRQNAPATQNTFIKHALLQYGTKARLILQQQQKSTTET